MIAFKYKIQIILQNPEIIKVIYCTTETPQKYSERPVNLFS